MSNHVYVRARRGPFLSRVALCVPAALAAGCLADAGPAPETQDDTGVGEQPRRGLLPARRAFHRPGREARAEEQPGSPQRAGWPLADS